MPEKREYPPLRVTDTFPFGQYYGEYIGTVMESEYEDEETRRTKKGWRYIEYLNEQNKDMFHSEVKAYLREFQQAHEEWLKSRRSWRG